MQVFVPYPSPIDEAKCLDKRRLRKQIIECDQILAAIGGKSEAWKNHPIVKMYSAYWPWLAYYRGTLDAYLQRNIKEAEQCSWNARYACIEPPFLTSDFCDQHKRRLYTKAPELYPQFAVYGKSEENWYVVNEELLKYVNGRRIIRNT